MSTVKKLIEIALDEEGYLEKNSNESLDDKTANPGKNNFTKYARDLDKVKIFIMVESKVFHGVIFLLIGVSFKLLE